MRTLADDFSSRANSIGFLRLVLATSVLVAHAWPLGLGRPNLGLKETGGQTDLGGLGVYGFFVLSGFLITASGLRFSLPRYSWHRFLRIFPGLWACLLITALVIAPLVAIYERGDLDGFWNHPQGPLAYLQANWWTGIRQFGISGLLTTTPYGVYTGGASVFDGSLWSLSYEFACYIMIASLAWTGVLKRAPRAVLLLTVAIWLVLLADFVRQLPTDPTSKPYNRGAFGPFPLVGAFITELVLVLFFLFLAGAVAQLYKHRLPMHPVLIGVAAVAFFGSMAFGGFFAIGLPAYAYLLLWAACKLPRWLQGVGRTRDYSYGIYIYAFPVQQVVALLGGVRYGVMVYILLSLAGTLVFAVPSWHLIERPAMSMKDRTPRVPRRLTGRGGGRHGPAGTDAPAPPPDGAAPPSPADGAPPSPADGAATAPVDGAAATAPVAPVVPGGDGGPTDRTLAGSRRGPRLATVSGSDDTPSEGRAPS